MTIRYEANPPKILPHLNLEESISQFVTKIKTIAPYCDAIHITENVLGFERASPILVGKIIKKEIPRLPITTSLRTRDKTEKQIQKSVKECIEAGFSGILILMGDPSQNTKYDSKQIPSQIVKKLDKLNSKIDLYLSVSNTPNFEKIGKKISAKPTGFVTQVVQSVEQVQNLVKNLKGFSVIPIVLFPSQKNEKSAKFLNLNLESYSENFEDFLEQIHQISGDVLITSPGDFKGLKEFLEKKSDTT